MDVVIPRYNLIKYSDNYSKSSGTLWQCYRDELAAAIENFKSFISKIRIKEKNLASGNATNVEVAVPLKYLRNFWRTLEMLLINCEINLILTWSADCDISSETGPTKFSSTDTKLYVSVVTL